nr:MAG TPA: hypothetical protein [Bacteriophage sp.]
MNFLLVLLGFVCCMAGFLSFHPVLRRYIPHCC